MCEPTIAVAASAALNVGSTIAGASAQNKAAKANESAARTAARLNSAELTRRSVQETIAATAQRNLIRRQALQARGSLEASLAASGLSGNTAGALSDEYSFAEDSAIQNTQRSLSWMLESINYQQVAEYSQMRQRIAQMPKANPLATALQISGSALDAFNSYRQVTAAPPVTPGPVATGNPGMPPKAPKPSGLMLPGLPLMPNP